LAGNPANAGNTKTDPSKPIPTYGCQEIRGPVNNGVVTQGDSGNGCSDGVNNNNVYTTDCNDDYYCRFQISGKCKEICTNGVDDNGNGAVDCQEWPQCPSCSSPPPSPGPAPSPICGDGICSGGETSKNCKGDCKGSGSEN